MLLQQYILMKQRKSTEGRSVFYRGISLREYLRKNTEVCKQIQYDDDSTIFLDQNHSPIQISDSLIHREKTEDRICFNESHISKDISADCIEKQMNLPKILHKGRVQPKLKCLLTQRYSTDISQVTTTDAKKSEMSEEKGKEIVQEIKSFKNGRSLSRKSILRESFSFDQQKTQNFKKQPIDKKGKSLNNQRHEEKMKRQNQMRQRYNILEQSSQKTGKRPLYLMRIKSHI